MLHLCYVCHACGIVCSVLCCYLRNISVAHMSCTWGICFILVYLCHTCIHLCILGVYLCCTCGMFVSYLWYICVIPLVYLCAFHLNP